MFVSTISLLIATEASRLKHGPRSRAICGASDQNPVLAFEEGERAYAKFIWLDTTRLI